MIGLLAAAALLAASSAATPPPPRPRPLVGTLRAKDQALLDATAPGDRATWDKALTADALYIDENGEIMDRAAFITALNPLPKGISGHIDIADYRVTAHGETALVVMRLDEHEDYFGVPLRAKYLMTETWVRQSGDWRLALVHAYVVPKDPPAVPVPAAALEGYSGRYAGPNGTIYEIRRKGDHLTAGQLGAGAHPLLMESPDLFFVPGQTRIRKLFQRGADGSVTGFLDRREGEDIHWARLP
jgi:hypothetical protein